MKKVFPQKHNKPKAEAQKLERKPMGITLGEAMAMGRESTAKLSDNERAERWLYCPPPIPEPENSAEMVLGLHTRLVGYSESKGWHSYLTELVKVWQVSADDAEKVFDGWIVAMRRMRNLSMSRSLKPTSEADFLSELRNELWVSYADASAVDVYRHLADTIESFEKMGNPSIPFKKMSLLHSGPFEKKQKSDYRDWLLEYWIKPEEGYPPLCLCSDGCLDMIVMDKRKRNPDSEGIELPNSDPLKQDIISIGLYRPAKPRLGIKWYERWLKHVSS